MIFTSRNRVRLTRSEMDHVRRAAARNGVALTRIETPTQLLSAILAGLPPDRQRDLLRFLETSAGPT
jgi:hypothetical protein